MNREWNDSQPIYRQLRDRVVAMIVEGVWKDCSARRGGFACGGRADFRTDRSERGGEDDRAECNRWSYFLRGRTEGAGTRSVEGTGRIDARRLLYRGCGCAAALDSG